MNPYRERNTSRKSREMAKNMKEREVQQLKNRAEPRAYLDLFRGAACSPQIHRRKVLRGQPQDAARPFPRTYGTFFEQTSCL